MARRILEERRKQHGDQRQQREGNAGAEGLDRVKASIAAATDAVRRQRLELRKKQRASQRGSRENGDMTDAASAAATAAAGNTSTSASRGVNNEAPGAGSDEDDHEAQDDPAQRLLDLHKQIEAEEDWSDRPKAPVVLLRPPRPFLLEESERGLCCCSEPPPSSGEAGRAVVPPEFGAAAAGDMDKTTENVLGDCWPAFAKTRKLKWRASVEAFDEDGLAALRVPAGVEQLLDSGRCTARLVRETVAAVVEAEERQELLRAAGNSNSSLPGVSSPAAQPASGSASPAGLNAASAFGGSAIDEEEEMGGLKEDSDDDYEPGNRLTSRVFASAGVPHLLADPIRSVPARWEWPPAEDEPPPLPPPLQTRQLPPGRGVGPEPQRASGATAAATGAPGFADNVDRGRSMGNDGCAELRVAVSRLAFHDHPLMGPEDRIWVRMRVVFGQYAAALQSGESEHLKRRLEAVVQALLLRRRGWQAEAEAAAAAASEPATPVRGNGSGEGGGGGGSEDASAAEKRDVRASMEGSAKAAADEVGILWRDALGTLSSLVAAETEALTLAKRLRQLWAEMQDQRREQRYVATPARLNAARVLKAEDAEGVPDAKEDQFKALGTLLDSVRDLHGWVCHDVFPTSSKPHDKERLSELLEACRQLLPHSGRPRPAALRLSADFAVTPDESLTLPRSERLRRRAVRQQRLRAVLAVNGAVAAHTPTQALQWPDFSVSLANLARLRLLRRPASVEIRICEPRVLLQDRVIASVYVPLPGGHCALQAGATTHALAPKAQWCDFAADVPMEAEGPLANRRAAGAVLVGMEWAAGVSSDFAAGPPPPPPPVANAFAPAADGSGALSVGYCADSPPAHLLPPPPATAGHGAGTVFGSGGVGGWLVGLWRGFVGVGFYRRLGPSDEQDAEQRELLLAKEQSGSSHDANTANVHDNGPRKHHRRRSSESVGSVSGGDANSGRGKVGPSKGAEFLRLLPRLAELDPNDPDNAAMLRLLAAAPGDAGASYAEAEGGAAAKEGDGERPMFRTWEGERVMAFSGFGPAALAIGVAIRYAYTDPRRWRECARHMLLRLRQARPSLRPQGLPLLESEIREDEAAQDLLDRFAQAAVHAEGQDLSSVADAAAASASAAAAAAVAAATATGGAPNARPPAWAPEAGKIRIAVDDSRLQDFRARTRRACAAQSRTAARRRATLAGVVREIPAMHFTVGMSVGSVLPQRRRALRPHPRPRAPGSVPITTCRLLVQVVSARNVPVRASEDAGGFAFAVAASSATATANARATRVGAAAAAASAGATGAAAAAGTARRGSLNGGFQAGRGFGAGDLEAGMAVAAVAAAAAGDGAAEVAEGRIPTPPNQVCSFVEVRFQQARRRTSAFEGRSPLWRETVELPFVPPAGSFTPSTLSQVSDVIHISLFDEVLFDDRPRGGYLDPEDDSEGLRTEKHFLGSVKLPFQTVYMAGKVDALLRLEAPPVNLGYRQAREGWVNPNGYLAGAGGAAGDGAAAAASAGAAGGAGLGEAGAAAATAEGLELAAGTMLLEDAASAAALREASDRSTYIRVMATLDPLPERPPEETPSASGGPASDADASLVRYARRWVESVQRSKYWPPGRQATAFVPDLDGDDVLLTRYLTPQAPPEGCDTIAKCAHFVRLVPFMEDWRAFEGGLDMWCTSQQFLDILAGDWEEHSILLHNYIAYLIEAAETSFQAGAPLAIRRRSLALTATNRRRSVANPLDAPPPRSSSMARSGAASPSSSAAGASSAALSPGSNAQASEDGAAAAAAAAAATLAATAAAALRKRLAVYLVLGTGVPEGKTVYVMVREIGGMHAATALWNASTGEGYDARDPRCPLTDVAVVASSANVWANTQKSGRPREMRFDLEDTTCWRPFFSWPMNPLPSPPLPTVQPPLRYRTPDAALVYEVEELIREAVKREMRRWRARKGVTAFNASVGNRLAEMLPLLEAATLAGGGGCGGAEADDHRRRLEPTLRSRDLVGFPLQFGFTDVDAAVSRVRATGVHENRHPEAQFALAVQVFPYASNVMSVWIYVAAITPR